MATSSHLFESDAIIILILTTETKRPAFYSLQSHADTEHAKGVENKEIFFFWGSEDDICSSIRDFCGLDDDPENLLVLLNIPGQEIHICEQVDEHSFVSS